MILVISSQQPACVRRSATDWTSCSIFPVCSIAEQCRVRSGALEVVGRDSAGSAAADLSSQAALERADGEVRIRLAALRGSG